jgi:hypothetical protein
VNELLRQFGYHLNQIGEWRALLLITLSRRVVAASPGL